MTLIDPRLAVTIDFGSIVLTGQLQHDVTQNALMLLTDEGVEYLSTNLIESHGIVPELGNVIIKNWSEHHDLAPRMQEAGIVRIVKLHTLPAPQGIPALEAYEVELCVHQSE